MPVTLVTGANKGLGRETARRLIGLGHTVYVGARDPAVAGPPPTRSAAGSCSST